MTRSPRRPDEAVEDLVAAYRADLLAAGMFAAHPVTSPARSFLTRVGAITVDCEVLATTDGQTLVILAPPPGSSALEKLRLLAVVGDQTVGSA